MQIAQGASPRGRLHVLCAICLAALVLPLSFTGGAVATAAIGRALAADPSQLPWVTNAFMLSFGSLLMAAGTLSDAYGRKRLFIAGLALLATVSIALAGVSSMRWLIVLRAVQGAAAAATLASGSAALAQVFEGRARARAFSLLGTTFGIGLAFGPLAGGLLLEHFGWRAIFATPAIFAAVSLLVAVVWMRETRAPRAYAFDWAGAASFSAMLVLLTAAIVLAPQTGWRTPLVIGLLAGAALSMAAFVMIELHIEQPMLELTLFRYPRFIGVQLLPIGTCYCYIVLIVLLTFRLGVEGIAPSDSGLLLLALSAPMLVVPLLAAWLSRWIGAGKLCAVGFSIAAVGLYLLAHTPTEAGPRFVGTMLTIGMGTALPWGLMDGLAVGVVPRERAGMAAGMFNTTRVAGEGIALATAVALLGVLVAGRLEPLMPGQRSREVAQLLSLGTLDPAFDPQLLRVAYLDGFDTLMLILSGVTLGVAVATWLLLGRGEQAAAYEPPAAESPAASHSTPGTASGRNV